MKPQDAINSVCKSCPHFDAKARGGGGCDLLPCKSRLLTQLEQGAQCPKGKHVTQDVIPEKPPEAVSNHVPANIRDKLLGPWVTTEQLHRDSRDFAMQVRPRGYDAIVGVPRSGMVPASVAALACHVPLYSLGEYGPLELQTGLRLRGTQKSIKKVLVMEDSSASGYSIKQSKKWMAEAEKEWEVDYAAIYATQQAMPNLDLWHTNLELPHWFEWNLWGNKHLLNGMNIGTDMDGILCPDFTAEQDDDQWRYLEAMKNMVSLIPPSVHVKAIITARLEKYRHYTEEWLHKNRITFDNLVMGPWATKDDRHGKCIGSWKAAEADRLGIGLFIESCPVQANVIKNRRIHPVLCPAIGGSIVL